MIWIEYFRRRPVDREMAGPRTCSRACRATSTRRPARDRLRDDQQAGPQSVRHRQLGAIRAASSSADQPRSFDWRKRRARRHPWGKVTPAVLQDVCDRLNAIVQLA
ncbi:MAG: hypothetical protein IPF73_10725 [Betaproteobacteria bacterium]|nr:hypothetical protein [Betaproteobacteria bacterium]